MPPGRGERRASRPRASLLGRARTTAPRVPARVLVQVAQVLGRAHTRSTRGGIGVHGGELHVEQRRPPVGAHDQVLLLVQVVVSHAARVHGDHERARVLEPVARQALRRPQRHAVEEAAAQHATGVLVGCVRLERGHAVESGEALERASLACEQEPRHDREGEAARAHVAAHDAVTVRALDALDAPEQVGLEDFDRVGSRASGRHLGSIGTGHARILARAGGRGQDRAAVTAPTTTTTATAVSIRGLSKRFGDSVALAPLDLELEAGRVCGLVGPNGSGKSTFLRLLVGLVPPTTGAVTVAGVPLVGEGLEVRRRVAFSPGEIAGYGELSAKQQLAFLLRGRPRAALARATEMARGLGLPLDGRMRTFSHGMKRQIMFCAVMAPDVPVRLLDEPTAGLDPTKRGEVVDAIRLDAEAGHTIVLSSHHFGEVARCCERVVFLAKGELVADERTAELAARAKRLLTLDFDGGVPLEAVARVAAALGPDATARERHVVVHLDSDDPLSALRAIPGDLPAPARIGFGTHSLEDLYRDLYGVDGL